jgi:uncharacterized YccA/Bax inhibitor family protein
LLALLWTSFRNNGIGIDRVVLGQVSNPNSLCVLVHMLFVKKSGAIKNRPVFFDRLSAFE